MIVQAVPSIEMVRLVNSGTEATMSALRLARAATGRKKIIKFDGGYHGHVDSLLVKAGSGGATFNVPDSAGVPKEVTELTLSVPYNDLDAVRAQVNDDDVAAIIVNTCLAQSCSSNHSLTGSQSSSMVTVHSAISMAVSIAILRARDIFWRPEMR